ncbi:MAG: GAF domain-containing protein, partial [Solirubrobacterales bacterium]|nr:GAF domain-containing protein [Solirubrobacterales bacterium]
EALAAQAEQRDAQAAEARAQEAADALAQAIAERDAAQAALADAGEAADALAQAIAERDAAQAALAGAGHDAELLARAEAAEAAFAEADISLAGALERAETAERALAEARGGFEEVHELRGALDAERAARAELEQELAETREALLALQRQASRRSRASALPDWGAPARPEPPALPPLDVVAAQARAMSHAAPATPDGPPPGFTEDALTELDAALAAPSPPRAAARAVLNAVGTATGWHAGALWSQTEDGDLSCTETWSAYMSGLEAWETMSWRTRVEDGVVAGAVETGEPAASDTEEMLACPRSRAASWAELGTLAAAPVVGPDGRTLGVLELARRERGHVDQDLLVALADIATRLGFRLHGIELELEEQGPRWELNARA